MNLSRPQKELLRRELGLLTADEAAAVLDCDPIDIWRQIALGKFAINSDAKGRTLLSTSDLRGFAGTSAAMKLKQTPRIANGWFHRSGPLDRNQFIKSLAANPTRAKTQLQAFLVDELRHHVLGQVKRLPINLQNRSASMADKFYRQGPQFFKTATQAAKKELLGRTFEINGRKTSLSSVIPALSYEIEQAIKEAF